MQHILIVIFFNQRINLNRLDQLCLARRRADHGSGRVAVNALNGLKVEDTLTHDYETLLLLLYIQSTLSFATSALYPSPFALGHKRCLPLRSRSLLHVVIPDGVWALCTSLFFASMCCEFLTCLGTFWRFLNLPILQSKALSYDHCIRFLLSNTVAFGWSTHKERSLETPHYG